MAEPRIDPRDVQDRLLRRINDQAAYLGREVNTGTQARAAIIADLGKALTAVNGTIESRKAPGTR